MDYILLSLSFKRMDIVDRRLGHYSDVIMGTMALQITSITIVYSTIYSGADKKKYQSSASLALCEGNSPYKGPVTRKMFLFDDVIMVMQPRQISST